MKRGKEFEHGLAGGGVQHEVQTQPPRLQSPAPALLKAASSSHVLRFLLSPWHWFGRFDVGSAHVHPTNLRAWVTARS